MLARTKVKGAAPRPAPWIEEQEVGNNQAIEEAEAGNRRARRIAAEEGGIEAEEVGIEWAIDKFLIRPVDRIRALSVVPRAG
jgi:hypothetical protein